MSAPNDQPSMDSSPQIELAELPDTSLLDSFSTPSKAFEEFSQIVDRIQEPNVRQRVSNNLVTEIDDIVRSRDTLRGDLRNRVFLKNHKTIFVSMLLEATENLKSFNDTVRDLPDSQQLDESHLPSDARKLVGVTTKLVRSNPVRHELDWKMIVGILMAFVAVVAVGVWSSTA